MPKFNIKMDKKNIAILTGLILCILLLIVAFKNQPKEINLLEYDNFLQSNLITNAQIQGDKIILSVKNKHFYVIKDSINLNELAQRVAIQIKEEDEFDWFWFVVFCAVILGFGAFYFKKQKAQANSVNLSQMVSGAEIIPAISNIKFEDVAGIKDVKIELMEIVDFLKNPKKYLQLGIKMPKGVLMIGPPGVGKTLVAKAVAGEAGVPFFYQSGASFVQIYVGMGAKKVRELFSKAKSYAPSIIFIGEIDAVGKARGGGRNDEREATLNQLLTEMDGFTDNSGVIVIAATNKIDMIDEALLRSGRFDRRVFLSLPELHDRRAILETYLKNKNHNLDLDLIARSTTGFSGAALATLVNEAAINALRQGRVDLNNDDFKAVENKVLFGKKQIHSLNDEEKEIQAIYKAAKALAAEWFGVEFDKISLLEDRFLPSDGFLESKTMILARIKVHLAGLAALKIYKNEQYTNQIDDLREARILARILVINNGMNGNLLANDFDVKVVLDECLSQSEEFVRGVKNQILLLKKYLIENESINKSEIYSLIRQGNES
nr:ATP-dependent metallopeptidase FtsH/Yme1/Tma family protein [Campylobacter sp.]